jgi:hypothetical protein
MASFEDNTVRVEKPGVALPLGDLGVQRSWHDDVKELEPPKVDNTGQDVNPFSAIILKYLRLIFLKLRPQIQPGRTR